MTRQFLTALSARRLLISSLTSSGLLACGAFDGGQSGTDSLEAIGVNKPTMKCEGDDKQYEAGDKVLRNAGCEECVCKESGTWNCVPVEECAGSDGASEDEGGGEDAPGAQSNTSTPIRDAGQRLECSEELDGLSFGGSSELYIAKDSVAQLCVEQVSSTKLCMRGSMYEAGENYVNWGGGVGLVMATNEGGITIPFDAASLGITNVTFQLTGVDGFIIRAYLNQVNDPTITNDFANYQENSFILFEAGSDGSVTIPLERAALPDWTNLDVDNDGQPDRDTLLDPTRLNSLQFFIAAQVGIGFDYDVCISDVQWVDANDQTVLPAE